MITKLSQEVVGISIHTGNLSKC